MIERGDVVWASLNPTRGHEQRGHRPHLVLSDARLAERLGLVIVVPMTSRSRPWATRVELAPGSWAIGEQPRTLAVERITRHDAAAYDTAPVVAVIARLLGVGDV